MPRRQPRYPGEVDEIGGDYLGVVTRGNRGHRDIHIVDGGAVPFELRFPSVVRGRTTVQSVSVSRIKDPRT